VTVGIGAAGSLGFALETTAGTYATPTRFVPINSESLAWTQETNFRRPIRQNAGIIGATAGRGHVEGDIEMEAFDAVIPYFLRASRYDVVKTGTTPNFTYTATPTSQAVPTKTMSITVVRNGVVFGYVGCIVGSHTFTVDNDMLMFNVSIQGTAEASQSDPTETWDADDIPYGHGKYNIQIPTSSQVFDCDGFEFTVENNAEVQFRLKDVLGSQFSSFGEREVTISTERDFESRTEYDAFKNLTSRDVTIIASQNANKSITLNAPVAFYNSYEVGLSGQGDLIRASVEWMGVINASGNDHTITVKTNEDLTIP
jgi:Phage tail tube protein